MGHTRIETILDYQIGDLYPDMWSVETAPRR